MSESSPHHDAAPHGHYSAKCGPSWPASSRSTSPSAAGYHALPPMKHEFLTPLYDLICRLMGLGPRFRDSIIGSLELAGSETVLDAGCGTGAPIWASASTSERGRRARDR